MSFAPHHHDENDDQTRTNPTEKPEYCGGEKAMFEFLSRELEYPEIARVNGESGLVQIQFVVNKDGKIRDAKVLRPVNPWLDAEALRVAKMLDCFTPGIQDGSIVESFYVLPVRFALSK
jgi:protein TonB